MKLFVFGLGYSARAVVERMRPRLETVWGTTRDKERLAGIAATGVAPILFNANGPPLPGRERPSPSEARSRVRVLAQPPASATLARSLRESASPVPGEEGDSAATPLISHALMEATHVLVSIAPDEAGDPVLRHVRAELATGKPLSIVYLSTVGVYGDHDGAWVDETSECRPVSKRSRQRLAAEAAWRDFAAQADVPVAIIRLAGIYGPGRGPFQKIGSGTARRIVKPGQVFNRIHVGDIAAIVEAAFAQRADGIFNGSDDEPAPPQDVLAYAAGLLGQPPPPEVSYADADLTPMARSFYGENKRVRNDRIKRELGISLAHPTYREGLRAVLEAEAERAHLQIAREAPALE